MVLTYLEENQPETFQQLTKERGLRAHMETLVAELYEERDRVFTRLKSTQPDISDEQHLLEAERAAIAQVLPSNEGSIT